MQCMKMLNLQMLKLIKHLTEKSKGLRWELNIYFSFYKPLLRHQLSFFITGEGGGGFGGSHDLQGD